MLRDMSRANTELSNCQFVVQQTPDGKVVIVVQLLHQTIPSSRNAVMGFDLLGGARVERAKKLADQLNEYVLGVFVTLRDVLCVRRSQRPGDGVSLDKRSVGAEFHREGICCQ
jgi:hypothetical protein